MLMHTDDSMDSCHMKRRQWRMSYMTIIITTTTIIIIDRSTVAGLLLQLVGHVLCTSGLQVAWETFWTAFFDSFFWTSVGPSCVALPRPREDGEEDCREDAADIGRNWVQNAPRRAQNRSKMVALESWAPPGCPGALLGGSWSALELRSRVWPKRQKSSTVTVQRFS